MKALLLATCALLAQPSGDLIALQRDLPYPVLGSDREWLEPYWRAWLLAATAVKQGTPQNALAPLYLDEGRDEFIYQWDTCFLVLFTRYAPDLFPAGPSLDNFYRLQTPDGYVPARIRETDGRPVGDAADPNATAPPLLSWAELELYRLTGDRQRLGRILPALDRQYRWLQANRRRPNGLYWTSAQGSVMENSPRVERAYSWVDLSAQQALNARCLAAIAGEVGDNRLKAAYEKEHADLAGLINRLCWDPADGFYYDLDQQGQFVRVKTAAGFWPLIAGVASRQQATALAAHLRSPEEFWRAHVFPSLSADHRAYQALGDGWLGGVWPALNYAIIRGLALAGETDLAHQAAVNHVASMAIALKQSAQLWTHYAPDQEVRGSLSSEDLAGAAGVGAVSLLIEQLLGVQADAATGDVYWRLRRTDRHGIRRLRVGANVVDLVSDYRWGPEATCDISATCQQPLNLTVDTGFTTQTKRLKPGNNRFTLKGKDPPAEEG